MQHKTVDPAATGSTVLLSQFSIPFTADQLWGEADQEEGAEDERQHHADTAAKPVVPAKLDTNRPSTMP